jgi:tetratricopeptide (TPR) repeat protein
MPVRPTRIDPRLLGLATLLVALGCSSHGRPQATPEGPDGEKSEGIRASAGEKAARGTASPQASIRQHVEAGSDYLSRSLYDDAEREFRMALEKEPGNLDALAGLGQVQVRRGSYSEAVPLLERATRISTQMVSSFRALGDAYAALGETEKAAVAYRQAVALSPGDTDVRLSLARSLTEIGEYTEAATICTAAIRMAKGQPGTLALVYRQLGEIHSRAGKAPEAMSALYKALELAPRDVETMRALATSAVRSGLYAEAAAALDRLLKMAPLDVAAKKQVAWVNFKLERYPTAIRDYEAVGDSLGTVDRYYLAQAYAKSNKVDRAIELFREVVRLDPQNYKGVYCNMAYAYYDANRYLRAIDTAKEGLGGDSTSACLKFCWAQALDKLGRHEEAIPMFETVLADPAYAESARRELERQQRIVRLLKTKDRGN